MNLLRVSGIVVAVSLVALYLLPVPESVRVQVTDHAAGETGTSRTDYPVVDYASAVRPQPGRDGETTVPELVVIGVTRTHMLLNEGTRDASRDVNLPGNGNPAALKTFEAPVLLPRGDYEF